MSRHLGPNNVVTLPSGVHIVLSVHAKADVVELLSTTTKKVEFYPLHQLRQEIGEGKVHVDSPETIQGRLLEVCETNKAYQALLFKTAVVNKINAAIKAGTRKTDAIKALLGTNIKLSNGKSQAMCSEREVYRILKAAEISSASLIPAYATRGNRAPRYDNRIIEIILQHTENLYAVPSSKISLPSLVRLVSHTARQEGIIKPDAKVTRKFVESVMVKYWNVDLEIDRLPRGVVKAKKAIAANCIRPGAPLSRVEMDGLHLPFVVKTDYGLNENVWLLMVIDCDTSLPLGWRLLHTNPTTEDTFACLERAIYPKTDLLNQMEIEFTVDPFGTPLNLVLDNGSENSRTRLAGITTVGITPQWAPVRRGDMKPFIERLNRSLKVALEVLPGCTRFDGKDGTRTEAARKEALLTFNELERWIVRFLFEKWPHVPLERFNTEDYVSEKRLGLTPAERWKNYEADNLLPLTPSKEKWKALSFVHDKRVLNLKTGISLSNYDFKGDNLKTLVMQYGSGARVDMYYNPFDYRTVYVPDRDTGEWIPLINSEVTKKSPAFSFDEAKKRKKERKSPIPEHDASAKFDADRDNFVLSSNTSKPSRPVSRKNLSTLVRADEAVKRKENSPLPRDVELVLPRDSFITPDAIPTFTTFHKSPRSNHDK